MTHRSHRVRFMVGDIHSLLVTIRQEAIPVFIIGKPNKKPA